MPDLVIRIKKKSDGSAALSCTRADGSVTWQRQEGPQGRFFPLHDMTHLAVESVLELDRAFYGLLSEGWDITTFVNPDTRGTLPHESLFVEVIVGYLDLERATGTQSPAEEFNDKARAYFADKQLPPPPFQISEEQLSRIRAVREGYFARWRALPAGDVLELAFDRAAAPVATATQTGGPRVG